MYVSEFAMFPILDSLVSILHLDHNHKECDQIYHTVSSGKVETAAYMTKSLKYEGSFLIMEFTNRESCYIIACCPDFLADKVKNVIVEQYNASCIFYGSDEIIPSDLRNKFESEESVLYQIVEKYNLAL